MVDLTPVVPAGRQIIQSYGVGRFKIAGIDHAGSVIVLPTEIASWPVDSADVITLESLSFVTRYDAGIDVLLVGTGSTMTLLDAGLREALRGLGIVADAMDTGAACRTFNVLLAEERRVAAALIALT